MEDDNPSPVTMHTFYFDGRLCETFIDENNIVKLNVYVVSKANSDLVLQEKYELQGNGSDLTVVKCGTFVDSDTGSRKPYVIVKSLISNLYYLLSFQRYVSSVNIDNNKFSAILQCEVADTEAISNYLHVLDGPILLWNCDRNIYLAFSRGKEQSLCKQTFPLPGHVRNFKVLTAVSCEDDVYIFIRCTYQAGSNDGTNVSSSETEILLWRIKQEDGKWMNSEINPSNFLPTGYACSILDSKITLTPSIDQKRTVDSNVVLLLEGGYIVHLENGVMKKCCLVKNVDLADVTCLGEWKLVHVFIHRKCVVWTSDSDISLIDTETEEICQTIHDVSSVTVGDFLRLGSPQLLLVFRDSSTKGHIGAWMLTDFAACKIDSRDITDPEVEEVAETGIVKAVESLYSNLQTSLSDLNMSEQHFTNKVKFLHNTWQQLHRTVGLDNSPYRSVRPLVHMYPDGQKQKQVTDGALPDSVGQLSAEILWRTTVDTHLVVGVRLHNNTDRTFLKCSIMLVPHSKGNISSGFSRWPPTLKEQTSNELGISSQSKRLKLDPETIRSDCKHLKPKSTVTVTASIDLTRWSFQHDVHLWVLLRATELTSAVGDGGECSREERTRVLCCDRITLSTDEYLQGKLAVSPDLSSSMGNHLDDSVVESSLTTVQKETRLRLTSRFTDLRCVWQMLQAGAGYTSTPGVHYLTHPTCAPLQHTRISHPILSTPNSAQLSVWTRNTNQLLLLVTHLHSHLPDDLSIHLDSRSPSTHTGLLSALGEELKTVSSASRTVLQTCAELTSNGGGSLLAGGHQGEGAVGRQSSVDRQSFSEEQSKVQRLEEALIDSHLLRDFHTRVGSVQRKTDVLFVSQV